MVSRCIEPCRPIWLLAIRRVKLNFGGKPMGATIMFSLSKNYFTSNLFSFLSFFLVFSATILLHGETVYAARYNYSCDSNRMTLKNVDDNQTGRTYTISGSCTQQVFSERIGGSDSVKNWTVNITAIWNKSGRQAIETVISEFGQLIRTFQCDYDPWLDPVSKCTITSHENQQYTPWPYDDSWWAGYEDMNYRQSFPTSTLAFNQQKRKELVSQAMARSLSIIEPVADQSFDNNEVGVTVVMERPVRYPPDSQVSIKVEEKPSWPEPGVTATNRKYVLSKNYQITENKLTTHFNLKDLDLWGGKWGVLAEIGPGSTPATNFTVTNIAPPKIHSPRANQTYSLEGELPLKITYDPEADLSISYSSRPEGGSDFKHVITWIYKAELTKNTGLVELNGFLGNIALFAGAEIAEVRITAWVEKMRAGKKLQSEPAIVVARILVPRPIITYPEENKKYTAPAEVMLILIKTYKYGTHDWKDQIELQVESTGPVGSEPIPKLFLPYNDNSYDVSEGLNALIIKYHLKEIGKYRFRARFVQPEQPPYYGSRATPWTDWRQIEVVVGLNHNYEMIDISEKIVITNTQHLENHQLKPVTSIQQLQPQTSKIVQTATLPTALKAPQSAEPHTKGLQNRPIAAAISAPKAAPTIIRPQENEHFAKPGPVQISARVSAADAGLVWDVEYQAFNASSFVRQRQSSAGALAAGGGTVKMARLTFPAPGTYRFRAKEEGDQARWSPWRTIVVGSPPALAPAARNIKLHTKPELSTKPQLQSDAVKAIPVTEEAPAAAPVRQVPTGVAPTAIKPNAVPKIKPLP